MLKKTFNYFFIYRKTLHLQRLKTPFTIKFYAVSAKQILFDLYFIYSDIFYGQHGAS